jgi:hypothetical protein
MTGTEERVHYEMSGDELTRHMLFVHDYDVRTMTEGEMQEAHVLEHERRKKSYGREEANAV